MPPYAFIERARRYASKSRLRAALARNMGALIAGAGEGQFLHHALNKFLAMKMALAGRSAKRRMKYGYQAFP